METKEFFADYAEANRYQIKEVIGKVCWGVACNSCVMMGDWWCSCFDGTPTITSTQGSYGVVCSAVDTYTGERVAIKKITNVFDHGM